MLQFLFGRLSGAGFYAVKYVQVGGLLRQEARRTGPPFQEGLLVVTRLFHDRVRGFLGSGQRVFYRFGTCQGSRHFLTHDHTDLWEFRDRNKLNTNVWFQIGRARRS